MGESDETQLNFSTLKLPFLHIPSTPAVHSPEHPSGASTPPLQPLASVPFKWEEEPGKPRPAASAASPPEPTKCLELPPSRALFMDPAGKFSKTPSPTSVLDGPYNVARPKFSSFRLFREGPVFSDGGPEITSVDVLFGGKKNGGQRGRGFLGRFKGGRRVVDGGSSGFSPSPASNCGGDEGCRRVDGGDGGKMRRNGSFSGVYNAKASHLLTTIYQGFKQVIQWKSGRKSHKQGQD